MSSSYDSILTRPRLVMASLVSRSASCVSRMLGHAGGNLPGQLALRVAPDAIGEMSSGMAWKAVVTGTNGKTTTTGLACHVAGMVGSESGDEPLVVSNSNGDNMTGGIATALLSARRDMAAAVAGRRRCVGMFEADELYTTLLLPDVKPDVLVLLNLSRDQLDRYAEMEMTQRRIADAVLSVSGCSLAYCCDDPLCQGVADMVVSGGGEHPLIPFGFSTGLGHRLPTAEGNGGNHDGETCPRCGMALSYDARFFGKLGDWRCPRCGYGRPEPLVGMEIAEEKGTGHLRLSMSFPTGPDMPPATVTVGNDAMASTTAMYDMCAAAIAGGLMAPDVRGGEAAVSRRMSALGKAMSSYVPGHGRDETFARGGITVTTRLAKNPAGMDAAIGSLKAAYAPCAADGGDARAGECGEDAASRLLYVAVNDQDADGHDVAWLWDSDALGSLDASSLGYERVLCGGTRRNDLAVRLAYGSTGRDTIGFAAGIGDAMAEARSMGIGHVDAIGNYTAFSEMVRELRKMPADGWFGIGGGWEPSVESDRQRQADEQADNASKRDNRRGFRRACNGSDGGRQASAPARHPGQGVEQVADAPARKVVHVYRLFPDALDLYGDSGNAVVLGRRMEWRGIRSTVTDILTSDDLEAVSFEAPGIVTIGGGSDAGQLVAAGRLPLVRDALVRFVRGGGIILAICGGYQLMGRSYEADGGKVINGLGLIPMDTVSAGNRDRIVGNTADLLGFGENGMTVVGFENHAGRTRLAKGAMPFGRTGRGHGNDGEDLTEGYLGPAYDNGETIDGGKVVGTYLHGPVLARNADLADALIMMAMGGKWDGKSNPDMEAFGGSLDDGLEQKAHAYDMLMCD